jgi:hypothetical protein
MQQGRKEMNRSTKKEWTDDKWPNGGGSARKRPLKGSKKTSTRGGGIGRQGPLIVMLCIVLSFTFTGCPFIQVAPSTDVNAYEILGRDIGTYLKRVKPDAVKDAAEWVDDALLMTNEELLSENALQVMYEYLLEKAKHPEVVMGAKSILTIMGVKINLNVSNLLPEGRAKYSKCVRGLLKGYSDATK